MLPSPPQRLGSDLSLTGSTARALKVDARGPPNLQHASQLFPLLAAPFPFLLSSFSFSSLHPPFYVYLSTYIYISTYLSAYLPISI
jgi:hypothetical protein